MSDQVPRPRRLRAVGIVLLAFALGAAAGVVVTSVAAERAARATLRSARGLFVYDQDQRAAVAWNAKGHAEALAYARCAYEAGHAEGASWFDEAAADWKLWSLAFLQEAVIQPSQPAFDKARPTEEGMALAKVAVALEALGRQREAEAWFARAAKAGGGDAERWRRAGLAVIGVTLPEGFRHPDGSVRR